MAVEAVVAVILQKLTDLLIEDSIAFDNVIDQIEDIRIQLRHMRGFLIDAELGDDPAAFAWATDYLGLLFSAEDKIEAYVLFLAAHGRRSLGFFQRRGLTLFAAAYDFFGPGKSLRLQLHDLARQIEVLSLKRPGHVVDASLRAGSPDPEEAREEKACAIGRSLSVSLRPGPSLKPVVTLPWLKSVNSFPLNRRSNFRFGSPSPHTNRSPRSPHSCYPDQDGPVLIGFTQDRRKLVDRLKAGNGKGGGAVIPLVGPTGSGKTTLVQTVYNLREIKTHFDCRAWVHVPDESVSSSQLLASLLQQVLKSNEGGALNPEQLISSVRDSLQDKTYLIVLDHVSDVRLWNQLKSALPNLGAGESKVILITRTPSVAASISEQESCSTHRLKRLCDEHSWELLIKESCLDQESDLLEASFRDKILRKCKGCPLDIALLGGLLSTKGPSCDEWRWYLNQPSCRDMSILQLSYNDLPSHSKLCLLYMALFPNEVDISVRRLHRLWCAEGFVRRSPGISEEDTVEDCFDDLVQRNLIKISKCRSDGYPQKCRLPRALLEYLYPKACQISLFYVHKEHMESIPIPPKLGVRRVIEYVDIKNHSSASPSVLPPFYDNVRSYLSFNYQKNDTPATEVGNFISKNIGNKGFGVLRVLDLEGVYKPTLPETLRQLFHLRYLGLRWTFIDQLPESLGDLPYLETLDLKRTYINSLPSSIWKLKRLRHLNLPEIRLDYKQKKTQSSLTELRTLIGLIVDDETTVKEELSQLYELQSLGITSQLSFSNDFIIWIQKLTNLRFLSFKSKDLMGRPSKINLEPLLKLSQLSRMSLLGNLEQLPSSNTFPTTLKVLALSVSRLNDDPMIILSKLPSLTVLRLLADSYLGTHINCPRNGFKNLRVLKLWMLKELVEWIVEEGGMPQLKELAIRYCCKLKQLPDLLMGKDTTMEELTLTAMPKEFVEEVKKRKQRHTVLTLNDYKFTPLPWENDPDIWNEV